MGEQVICSNKVLGLFKNLIFSYAIKDAATNLQIGFETAANIVNICKPKTKTIPLLWISLFFFPLGSESPVHIFLDRVCRLNVLRIFRLILIMQRNRGGPVKSQRVKDVSWMGHTVCSNTIQCCPRAKEPETTCRLTVMAAVPHDHRSRWLACRRLTTMLQIECRP